MNITKVIKAPNTQQCIGSFVACYQQSTIQVQNPNPSLSNDLTQTTLKQHPHPHYLSYKLKLALFPQNFIYKYLLQNISSLNNLDNQDQHDYSQFQSQQNDQFIHVMKLNQQLSKQEKFIQFQNNLQTQTVKSEYYLSELNKTSNQTQSDSQSIFGDTSEIYDAAISQCESVLSYNENGQHQQQQL